MVQKYNTRQKEILIDALYTWGRKGISIKDLHQRIVENGLEIGQSTTYRRVSLLEEEGLVRSFMADGVKMYEIVDQEKCHDHLHLVCESCHKTIHLGCNFMEDFNEHVLKEHGFKIDKPSTVIYGRCKDCIIDE